MVPRPDLNNYIKYLNLLIFLFTYKKYAPFYAPNLTDLSIPIIWPQNTSGTAQISHKLGLRNNSYKWYTTPLKPTSGKAFRRKKTFSVQRNLIQNTQDPWCPPLESHKAYLDRGWPFLIRSGLALKASVNFWLLSILTLITSNPSTIPQATAQEIKL